MFDKEKAIEVHGRIDQCKKRSKVKIQIPICSEGKRKKSYPDPI